MITNPSVINKKYKCNDFVADYLIRKYDLPVLAVEKGYVYFTDNEHFRKCLSEVPFHIKLFSYL